ncbi:MAG: endonuclease/exonuclease/phosphatase family protein [Bacteroidales bacterium]|nr:endonuclease/exonuclease/phosphatase family protein [Bacteroidales bacterium]
MKLKSVFAAFVLVLLCAGCAKGPKELVVMSYNVRLSKVDDGENSWSIRRSATPLMLRSVKPDIIGLQEAMPDQEGYIIEQCPEYSAYGVGRNDGADEGERMSIVYNSRKLEMKEHGTWWLSETPDVPSVGWDAKYPRTATWALMKERRSGKEFYFVDTHLDHRGVQARINGLKMVVGKIREMNPDIPMFLVGDFNVEPADSCLFALDGLMLDSRSTAKESDETPSFNGFRKAEKIIDYIYYSGIQAPESFRVVTESYDNKPFISDHYPIVAKFTF